MRSQLPQTCSQQPAECATTSRKCTSSDPQKCAHGLGLIHAPSSQLRSRRPAERPKHVPVEFKPDLPQTASAGLSQQERPVSTVSRKQKQPWCAGMGPQLAACGREANCNGETISVARSSAVVLAGSEIISGQSEAERRESVGPLKTGATELYAPRTQRAPSNMWKCATADHKRVPGNPTCSHHPVEVQHSGSRPRTQSPATSCAPRPQRAHLPHSPHSQPPACHTHPHSQPRCQPRSQPRSKPRSHVHS